MEWDQLPISGNQDIVVNLVEPQFDKDSPTIKKNELNYTEWALSPAYGLTCLIL